MKNARTASILLACLTTTGCQEGVEIEVSGNASAISFSFKKMGGFAEGVPQFQAIYVTAPKVGDSFPTVWSAYNNKPSCEGVTHAIYGQAPAGFSAERPSLELKEGVSYDISVHGCGASGGATFRVVHGKVVSV